MGSPFRKLQTLLLISEFTLVTPQSITSVTLGLSTMKSPSPMHVKLVTVLETQSTLLTVSQTKPTPLLIVKINVMRECQMARDVKDSSSKRRTTMVVKYVASIQVQLTRESAREPVSKLVRSVI